MVDRWNTLFNLVVMMFWLYFWNGENKKLYFNPYLGSIMRISSRMVNYLHPLTGGISLRGTAFIAMIILLVLRAFLKPLIGNGLAIGLLTWHVQALTIPMAIATSFLMFLKFLVPFWAIAALYVHNASGDDASEEGTIKQLAVPFGKLNRQTKPIVLVVFVSVLLVLMNFISPLYSGISMIPHKLGLNIGAIFISVLYELINVLNLIRMFCIFLIIFSWIGLFTNSMQLAGFSRSWLYFLMGPLKNVRLAIGPLDLTPLIFFIGVAIVYGVLQNILFRSFATIVG